tara:strand:+ start:622 stop:1125 length:504 start_codon:yes stop_codon:yes gene_type:complete
MGKAKDGSECYTRNNKSGGKYVTCEGTQKARELKRRKKKLPPKEDEVRPVDKDVPKVSSASVKLSKEQTNEIKKILKENDKNKKLMLGRISITKDGKYLRAVGGHTLKNVDELIKKTNKVYKSIPLVYNNVIFTTNPYTPNPKTNEQDGVYRKPKMIFKGKMITKMP